MYEYYCSGAGPVSNNVWCVLRDWLHAKNCQTIKNCQTMNDGKPTCSCSTVQGTIMHNCTNIAVSFSLVLQKASGYRKH